MLLFFAQPDRVKDYLPCSPSSDLISLTSHTLQSAEKEGLVTSRTTSCSGYRIWPHPIRFKILNLLFSNALLAVRTHIASLVPRPFLRGGGERAWYILIAHALSITQNLGDCIRIGYLPCILVFQYVNHCTSR